MKKGYKVHLIGRISLQYSLIKVNRRYYLLDYANPKKLSTYFIFDPQNWKIYDVTDEQDKFLGMAHKKFLSSVTGYITAILFVGYIFSIICIRDPIYDPAIAARSKLIMTVIVFLLLITIVNLCNKKIDVSKYDSLRLDQINKNHKLSLWLGGIGLYLIFFLLLLLRGITFLHYILYFSCIIMLILSRFRSFFLDQPGTKLKKLGIPYPEIESYQRRFVIQEPKRKYKL